MNLGKFQGEKVEGETAHYADESVSLHILFSAIFWCISIFFALLLVLETKVSVDANLVSFERRANKL